MGLNNEYILGKVLSEENAIECKKLGCECLLPADNIGGPRCAYMTRDNIIGGAGKYAKWGCPLRYSGERFHNYYE